MRGGIRLKDGAQAITWTQKKLLAAYARCNMSVTKTAQEAFLTPRDINYHLRMVRVKTGLDPAQFVDLVKLLFMCGEGGMFELEELL